eukprot:757844-Hanusia_phi.AAC.3
MPPGARSSSAISQLQRLLLLHVPSRERRQLGLTGEGRERPEGMQRTGQAEERSGVGGKERAGERIDHGREERVGEGKR